jgi:hypothetical protein
MNLYKLVLLGDGYYEVIVHADSPEDAAEYAKERLDVSGLRVSSCTLLDYPIFFCVHAQPKKQC